MNWLAHLYLSAPTPQFRLGNLLPDLVGRLPGSTLQPEVQRGVECHWRIDAFTDQNPLVRRAVGRLASEHRRFGGIIVDVLFDYFLASNWPSYAHQPLDLFVEEVFESFEGIASAVPEQAWPHLRRIRRERLLCSYETLPGIRDALRRTGGRLRNPVDLGAALNGLDLSPLKRDFDEFFAELRAHVAPLIETFPVTDISNE